MARKMRPGRTFQILGNKTGEVKRKFDNIIYSYIFILNLKGVSNFWANLLFCKNILRVIGGAHVGQKLLRMVKAHGQGRYFTVGQRESETAS